MVQYDWYRSMFGRLHEYLNFDVKTINEISVCLSPMTDLELHFGVLQ